MKAIIIKEFGTPDKMVIGDYETPVISENEILVKVFASAINRADTLQRKGFYPAPTGESPILGLEMAGVVEQVGSGVKRWKKGDRVFGLLGGGGYAQYATLHADMAMEIPVGMSFTDAAAIPEVFLTAFQALNYLAKFQPGERILIHAGGSGVGTAAIQLAKVMGASDIYVTASKGKHEMWLLLGASAAIDYKSKNFENEIKELTNGHGVDVIIDFMAASYFQQNLNSLNFDGRMILLALMGGLEADSVNMINILRKRLRIIGSTLRARTLDYKIGLTRDMSAFVIPLLSTGKLKPIIDSVYNWQNIAEAHSHMEANKNIGKIVMEIEHYS